MSGTAEVIEDTPTNQVAEFRPFETQLAEFKAQYVDRVYDLTSAMQLKQAKSDKLAIGKVVAKLDAVHKEIKAPVMEQITLLDGERRRIKDDLRAVQERIKSQLDAHQAAIDNVKRAITERIEHIKSLALLDIETSSSMVIDLNRDLVSSTVIDDSFGEFEADAALAKMRALEKLNALYGLSVERENALAEQKAAEKAEAERIALEREEAAALAAKQAAEQEAAARIEAEQLAKEQAEQAAREAVEKGKRDLAAAKEKAKKAKEQAAAVAKQVAEQAERDKQAAIEQERQKAKQAELARFAEEQRIADEQAAREADKQHRADVDEAVIDALLELPGMTADLAGHVVVAIADSRIPNVKIHY